MAVSGNFPDKAAFFLRDTSALGAAERMGLYVGATGAWHRDLFDKYGGIDEGCYEDLILGFRAALEDRVAFIDEVLVKYRTNVGISAEGRVRGNLEDWSMDRIRALTRSHAVFVQRLRDATRSSHKDRAPIVAKLERAISLNRLRVDYLEQSLKDYLGRNVSRPFSALMVALSERRKLKRAKSRLR